MSHDATTKRRARRFIGAVLGTVALAGTIAGTASAQLPSTTDPRVGLAAGAGDTAAKAALGLEHLSNSPLPAGVNNVNSDITFQGDYAFVGNYNGVNIYNVANPASPQLVTSLLCPGSQNDVSVYKNLLFMSVEATSAKKDCTTTPAATAETRFRGIRIFDISNIQAPVQVGQVQTCRGSHTHTLVKGKNPDNVYIYVQGAASVRSATELAGCNSGAATTENPSQWRIEIIKVPLAAPATAAIVNEPRLFKNEETGALNGLQNGPTAENPRHPSGSTYSPSPNTNHCHDITVYEEINLAAGACSGNGLLIDISDPEKPVRIDAVADPNYSYWHGATFTNDGKAVIFTDEWGGGSGARCRATDQLSWGADAIYEIVNKKLVFRSYYKMPAAQTTTENCVAHVGNLIPVPNKNILVQAWYQGGISVVDFTDLAKPKEIAYFDRGPISATSLVTGGFWSAYYYNGRIFGSEIARGLDTFKLTPSATGLTAEEIAYAEQRTNKLARLNAQSQDMNAWTSAPADTSAGGTVAATLSLTLGTPASFGAFTPGVEKTYESATTANVVSTAGDALLSVSDTGANAGHLVNGAFSLPQPLQARARNAANTGTAYNNVGSNLNLLTYSGPVSNDKVDLQFAQKIGSGDALRTGAYSKTLTFTLSTTNP